MKTTDRLCQKCKQAIPSEANFCPHCGIDLSTPVSKDYTQASYSELVVAAKRIEVAIIKDERTIEQIRQRIEAGTFRFNDGKRLKAMRAGEAVETIKRDMMGYRWDTGGYTHPMLHDLVRIKEELSRRQRLDEYQHLEQFIREMQGRSSG